MVGGRRGVPKGRAGKAGSGGGSLSVVWAGSPWAEGWAHALGKARGSQDWLYGLYGLYGCMGVWVCGCMGAWVYGCTGARV